MNLRRHAQTLTIAGLLALSVRAVPTMQAHAKPRHPQPTTFCTMTDPQTGEIVFYMPGETVKVGDLTFECTAFGWAYYPAAARGTSLLGETGVPVLPGALSLAPGS